MRLITLSDGTSMGDDLIILETNAPVEELKKLEQISCQVYIDGGSYEDVPIWIDSLIEKGYECKYVDSHPHINPFNTSKGWSDKNYPNITEHYVIENQPELK